MNKKNDRKRISITFEDELLEWIESKIKDNTFHNFQHAVDYCLSKIYGEEKPRFEHFNCYDEHVTLWDNLKKRLIDVHFRDFKPYIYCELCESSNCDHIKFVLTIPKVVETLRKKGWKIEEGKIVYVPP